MAGLVAFSLVVLRWAPWDGPEPADPTVLATYQGGVVTREQLRRELEAMPRDERSGFLTPDGLRALVVDAVVRQVTRRWAEEKRLDAKSLFKDAMKHATEEILIGDVSDQIHRGRIQVGEAEIQASYDQNRTWFGGRPLVEVKDQIRRTVAEQKEQAFVADYLKDLKERASLQVDSRLLEVPEPAEQELAGYYQENRERFRVPEQAKIAQIQVSVSLAGTDAKARAKAELARARAAAGENFAQLAREVSDGPEKARGGELATPVTRGSRGPAFDEAVFPLPAGGVSAVFKEADSHYVVTLLDRWPQRLRPYEEVRAEIARTLRAERERQVYRERAAQTLFSIHGRRTTLGEFVHELNELPPDVLAQYAGPEGKRKLLGALIDRLLVVEDAAEQTTDAERRADVQQVRTDLLARLLHREEVDEKVTVSDAEIRAEYERNQARYADPAKLPLGASDLDRWIGETGDPVTEFFEHAAHEELLSLKVGDVSPILLLGDSCYLFQIREKQETRPRSLEEAQRLVRRTVEARKHEELNRKMERGLMERMQLRIYESRLRNVLDEVGGRDAGRQ